MDPYQILGIAPGASEEEVRAAYRRLAQTDNPDNYEAGPLQDQAREKMQQIFDRRRPVYLSRAQVIADASVSPMQVADAVLTALRRKGTAG